MAFPSTYLILLPVGACIGSFSGMLVYRLPRNIIICNDRSVCEDCNARISAYDLVPLISFLWLKGRCRFCKLPIRKELFAIEVVATLLAGFSAFLLPGLLPALCGSVLGWGLLILGWIDARHFYLPDLVTYPFILIGFIVTWLLRPTDLLNHFIGAALGYLMIRGVNELYKALRGRDGIGQGDAKLMALAGAWLGWQFLPWVIISAAIIGIILAVSLHMLDRQKLTATARLPFGACLAPAIFSAYIFQATNLPFIS